MEQDKRDTSRNKVLVVGLDGGTYSVLGPFMDDGKLPTLAAMMKRGCWGELASTIPPHTAPAWASFITGKNSGKHGIFQFGLIDRSVYKGRIRRILNSSSIPGETLWDTIGRAKKTVGIMNVPLTYPPRPVNGFMVTGMLTPRDSEHFTYPSSLKSALGDYKIDVSVGEGKYSVLDDLNTEDEGILLEFIGQLRALVEIRTETAIRLMRTYSPDFFMILFTETDRLQHIFWPYLDRMRGQSEDPMAQKIQAAVEDFYQHLDGNLAKLFGVAGQGTAKILMSDHGFGPATKKDVNFNVWLRDNGLLRLGKSPKNAFNPRAWLRRVGLSKETLYPLMSFLFPGNVVRRLERAWAKVVSMPIDWSQTKAVFIPVFEFVGGIEIVRNEHADQLGGAQLRDYEDFRTNIIQRLLALRDPHTAESIVLAAYRREELYTGAHTHDAPDIIFVMATDYRGEKGLTSKQLISKRSKNVSLWTGTHRREGVVILSGPNISPGRMTYTPQIQDLAPTILYLMGLAIPEDMDGKVIEEAIEGSYLADHEIKYAEPISYSERDSKAKEMSFSEEEMEKVRKQLESLGYLS